MVYVPVIFGLRFIPIVILSFIITDLVIGYHGRTHWTWGSVLYRTFIKIFCKKFFSQE